MLDGHDSSLSEQLLRVVVDQLPVEEEEEVKERGRPLLDTLMYACVCVCVCLRVRVRVPVDEAVDSVFEDSLHLLLHLLLLCQLDLRHLGGGVHADPRAEDLKPDRKRVSGRGGDVGPGAGRSGSPTLILSVSMPVLAIRILTFSILFGWFTPIFLSSRKPGSGGQVSRTRRLADDITGLTFVQVRVRQVAAQLLDDVDGVQVPGALQAHDGVHRQPGEVVFVMSQQFGGQRRPGDVQQVLLEAGGVVAMETAGEEKGSRSGL